MKEEKKELKCACRCPTDLYGNGHPETEWCRMNHRFCRPYRKERLDF